MDKLLRMQSYVENDDLSVCVTRAAFPCGEAILEHIIYRNRLGMMH